MKAEDELFFNDDPRLSKGFLPVAYSQEIDESLKVFEVLSNEFVLTRINGTVHAYLNRCPHRRARLSLGHCEDGVITCAYHGWRFNAKGSCIEIPALPQGPISEKAKLTVPYSVEEKFGVVFIALERPVAPPPEVKEADLSDFLEGTIAPFEERVSVGLMADNFLDVAHFPFVHKATFGDSTDDSKAEFQVTRKDHGFEAIYEHWFINREDPLAASGLRPLRQRRRLTYRYFAPLSLTLTIDFLDSGGRNVIGFFLCPTNRDKARVLSKLWRNDLTEESFMKEAVAFEEKIIEEDLLVQRSYRELALPLNPSAELHTTADRVTTTFRRVLKEFLEA